MWVRQNGVSTTDYMNPKNRSVRRPRIVIPTGKPITKVAMDALQSSIKFSVVARSPDTGHDNTRHY
jgi:hypothetical protein